MELICARERTSLLQQLTAKRSRPRTPLQCATIAKCKTYSPTDCKCTACDQYFDVGSLGTCQVGSALLLGRLILPGKCSAASAGDS